MTYARRETIRETGETIRDMITILTVDAVAGIDRDKALGDTKANYACAPFKRTVEALVDFLDHFERASRANGGLGGGMVTYPLELVSGRRDIDALTTKLARAFLNKTGARFEHVAKVIGGDPHEAFENDISTGRRIDGTLEEAIARAAVLNDRVTFERIAKAAFPGSLSFRLVT